MAGSSSHISKGVSGSVCMTAWVITLAPRIALPTAHCSLLTAHGHCYTPGHAPHRFAHQPNPVRAHTGYTANSTEPIPDGRSHAAAPTHHANRNSRTPRRPQEFERRKALHRPTR